MAANGGTVAAAGGGGLALCAKDLEIITDNSSCPVGEMK